MQKAAPKVDIDVSYISKDLSYFFVFKDGPQEASLKNIKPTVLVYRDTDQQLSALIKRYYQLNKMPVIKAHFCLAGGSMLRPEMHLRDLKRELRREDINGISLFIQEQPPATEKQKQKQKQKKEEPEAFFEDQCCLTEYLGLEQDYQHHADNFTLNLEIEKTECLLSVDVDVSKTQEEVLNNKIVQEVKTKFGVEINQKEIINIKNKETGKPIAKHNALGKQIKLYNGSFFILTLDKPERFKNNRFGKDLLTIYDLDDKKSVRVDFSVVRNLKFSAVYEKYLKGKDKNICLKVMDQLIKGEDSMKKLAKLFGNAALGVVRLVGRVVGEKPVFYKWISDLQTQNSFSLDELDYPETSHRKQCQSKVKDRMKAVKQEYFKKEQHIEPILIYTSDLRYKDKTGKEGIIYNDVNYHLRSCKLLSKSEEEFKQEWKNRFSSALLKHLNQIEKTPAKVYRGVDYDLCCEKGDSYTFVPFTSTSRSRDVAIKFSTQNYPDPNLAFNLSLLVLNVKTSKPIEQFSFFQTEAEHLLEPYSEFIVTSKKNVVYAHPEYPNLKYPFTVYEMDEIETKRELPPSNANFIIWIDDKPNEGQFLFDMVTEFSQPTILVQLLSTQQFDEWLTKQISLLDDATAKIVVITNMTRTEEGVVNETAGVQAINLLRTYSTKVPVFCYIFNIQKAYQKLKEGDVSFVNLMVGNHPEELKQFLSTFLELSFKPKPVEPPQFNPEPTEPTEPTKPAQNKKKGICGVQ